MLIIFLGGALAMFAMLLSVEFAATPRDSLIYDLTHSARSIAAGLALIAVAPLLLTVVAYLLFWLVRAIL